MATTQAQRQLFFKRRSSKKKTGWFTNSEAAPSPVQWLEAAAADPADTVIDNSTQISQRAQLRKGLAALDERSRDIVEQRWLAAKKTTLQTLATRYKLSVERSRQIEASAMQKLRSSFDPFL